MELSVALLFREISSLKAYRQAGPLSSLGRAANVLVSILELFRIENGVQE
jgi:hypothetical protein